MTHTQIAAKLFIMGLACIAGPGSLYAQSPVEVVQWQDLCKATQYKTLTITTANGEVEQGFCTNVTNTELTLAGENQRIIKIGRSALSKVFVKSGHGGQELRSLHRHIHGALKFEANSLLTEAGPLSLIAIPPTLAWGAVALPFCAVGDLRYKLEPRHEIRVI